ncbi:MAG: alpha-methylacyl-CoA racemase, partial [Streptosporangiaceae bacterium]|nr:alpha-methylacyl-CoA racemase [Streptosporangiaceae bacterium]
MGPLGGLRVIELASLAPAPFGCMVLSDLGAEVLRVDRPD